MKALEKMRTPAVRNCQAHLQMMCVVISIVKR